MATAALHSAESLVGGCSVHIPIAGIPAHVRVVRHGRQLSAPPAPRTAAAGGLRASIVNSTRGLYLQVGDRIRVTPPGRFTFSYAGNYFRIRDGRIGLYCRSLSLDPGAVRSRATGLAVGLQSGRVEVRSGAATRGALVLSPEMLTLATVPGTDFVVARDRAARRTWARTLNWPIVAASTSDQALRITTRVTYAAISDAQGLRLDIWPFSISSLQRSTTGADALVPFWADGQTCSVGCSAPGAIPGWPIRPFHEQHAIRAGINELRPANFHVAVDIEATNFQPVYAIQSGYVHIRYPGTADVNVDVGQFDYWHINPTVSNGQHAIAYKTELGWVQYNFKHVALSEIGPQGQYLNPLRPGGSLRPYANTEPAVIGIPQVYADGRVIVGAFDPQSVVEKASYETPVLAPAALAWRLYDARGRDLTGLQWALRGSQNYPPALMPVIFAPGAADPGYDCFADRVRCIPNWVYWLAGGLTEPLPVGSLPPGRYRLTVYAWDWAGNTSALDYWLELPVRGAPSAPSGPLSPNFDYP